MLKKNRMHANPPEIDKKIARWLLTCCALVFLMVVLGGVTRLTGSGLSMVDWRPVTGFLPPLSDAAWQETFAMYQQSPEFQKVNSQMDVGDFKGIFWLEFLHRFLGRMIGIVFLVPFLVFAWRGHIHKSEWLKYTAMFILGGLQGVLGWYMVKSGLVDNPNVSQYRLTAHLIAAFLVYAYMFWVALSLLFPADTSKRHPWYGKNTRAHGRDYDHSHFRWFCRRSESRKNLQHISNDGRALGAARTACFPTLVAKPV